MCVKPALLCEHEPDRDTEHVPNFLDGIAPGGADSPDLDHRHCSWSPLLLFRCMDCSIMQKYSLDLTIVKEVSRVALLGLPLSVHKQVIGPPVIIFTW